MRSMLTVDLAAALHPYMSVWPTRGGAIDFSGYIIPTLPPLLPCELAIEYIQLLHLFRELCLYLICNA